MEREAFALIDKGIAVDYICLRDNVDKVSEKVKGFQLFLLPVMRYKDHEVLAQLLEYLLFFVNSSIFMARQYIQQQYNVIQVHYLPELRKMADKVILPGSNVEIIPLFSMAECQTTQIDNLYISNTFFLGD